MDFATALLVGTGCSQQIVRPALRRLNTWIAGCALRYNKSFQQNILLHRLLERMVKVATSKKPKAEIAAALNKLDKEGEAYMKHAEKKRQRLKSGRIPFSPKASLWIRQSQVYRSLLRWHAGKIRNCGNLQQTARRCQITAPFQFTVDDIKLRLCICKEKCIFFLKARETTLMATLESMPQEGAGNGGRGCRAPDPCNNKEGERSSILEETELHLG